MILNFQITLREQLGYAGRNGIVQKYSLQEMLNETESLYEYLRVRRS